MLLSHREKRVLSALITDGGGRPVSRVNHRFRREHQQPGFNGLNKLIIISSRKVCPAYTPLKKGIPGDHKACLRGVEGEATGGVPGYQNSFEGILAYADGLII